MPGPLCGRFACTRLLLQEIAVGCREQPCALNDAAAPFGAFAVTGGWLYSLSFFSHLTSPKPSMERILENAMYASRWLLAPIYFGLSLGLLALALKFFQEVVHVLPNVFALS